MPTTYAIPDGRTVMAATTYTGNGGSVSISNAVNGVSFQPDFVWIKNRAAAVNHQLQNSNAGWQYGLNSNTTSAEYSDANAITGSTSSGWSMNNNYNSHNQSGVSYVGWNWKAGGTAVSNTAGSITSSVSANTTAGFSVVTYSANGSTGTVGHGLGVAPSMIIVKKRNAVERWCVFHTSTSNAYIYLNETFAAETANANLRFGNNSSVVQPTSTVFTIGSSNDVNGTSGTYVAYCFAAVAGYSAFGSFSGNGSADGPFVYTSFRPRWIMWKNSSTGATDWTIVDSSRNTYNVANSGLQPNGSYAEASNSNYQIDFLSNGFKIRTTNAEVNQSGISIIYACFAEVPFKFANAR